MPNDQNEYNADQTLSAAYRWYFREATQFIYSDATTSLTIGATTLNLTATTLTLTGALGLTGDLVVTGDLTITGDFNMGNAILDTLILSGRVATSTEAGAALTIDGTYAYTEGQEYRYQVTAFSGSSFAGRYIRAEAATNAATGKSVYGDIVYGVCNNVTMTTGSLWGALFYAYNKGVAAVTINNMYAVQAELTWDASRTGDCTITTEAAIILAKVTGGRVADYTQINGIIVRLGEMDGDSQTFGTGLLLQDDAAMGGTSTLTTGIDIAIGTTTGITIGGACADGVVISGACSDNGIEITGACTDSAIQVVTGAFGTGLNINADGTTAIGITSNFTGTTGILLAGTATNGVSITGACTTGVSVSGSSTSAFACLTGTYTNGLSVGGTVTTGVTVGACTTGVALTGALTTGVAISGTSTTAISVTGNATTGLHILTGTFATGVSVAGTLTTGVTVAACTTGYQISGAFTDGLKISAAGTNYIDINNVATTGGIGLHFIAAFLGKSIETGTYSSSASNGVTLDSTNTRNASFLADDAGANIGSSVRNMLARTMLTTDQSAGSIRSVMGQLKLADTVDVTTGVYTGCQGYVELAGTHVAQTASHLSCFDASLEIGTSLTVDSGGLACGIHVETTGAGTITNNGDCAAIYIDAASGADDWPVGLDIQNCAVGVAIGASTMKGIDFAGIWGGAASASGIIMGVGTSGTPATSSTPDEKFIEFRCQTTATSNDNRLMYLRYEGNGAGATVECLRAFTKMTAALGNARGAKFSLDGDSNGRVTGEGCGVMGQWLVADAAISSGTYSAVQADIYHAGSSSSIASTQTAFFRGTLTGDSTGIDVTDDNAYLLELDGNTIAGGNIVHAQNDETKFSHLIRCRFGGTVLYLMASDST